MACAQCRGMVGLASHTSSCNTRTHLGVVRIRELKDDNVGRHRPHALHQCGRARRLRLLQRAQRGAQLLRVLVVLAQPAEWVSEGLGWIGLGDSMRM